MSFFSRWLYGVDLDEEQARNDQLNRELAAENQRARDKYENLYGTAFADDYYAQAEAHRAGSNIVDVDGEVADAFGEGFNDGIANIRGVAGDVIGTPFKLIPWQLWALAGVALFIWAGGADWLKGRLAR